MNLTLFNIQHFSINDGPGIRTVIFFKGCPLDCIWCHNPEGKSQKKTLSFLEERCVSCGKCVSICFKKAHQIKDGEHILIREKCVHCGKCVDACSYGALEMFGKSYTLNEILDEIEKDSIYYENGGGITISGGEPFVQFDALISLLKQLKKKGYHTCIETSGYTTSEKISEASGYVDLFLYDYKESDNSRHLKYTGVNQIKILENLNVLEKLNAKVILRCPVIPHINDYDLHFQKISEIANQYNCIKCIELMPYHPLGISKAKNIGVKYEYENSNFAETELMEKYCEIIKKNTCKDVTVSK